MPTKQNLVFKKLGFYATKSGFHAKQTKIGFHATKQNLAPMPQNLWLPCHKTKTWLSRHKNRLSCQTKFWLSRHPKFGFQAIKKPGFLPQNLAFMPKNNHLTKDFHKMTTFWSNFQTNHSHSIFAYVFIKSELKWNKGIQKKNAKNVYTWRYPKKRRKSLLQIRRLVRHGLQP